MIYDILFFIFRRSVDNELETVTELVPGDPGAFPFVPFRYNKLL